MDLMTIIGLLAGVATVYYVLAQGEILNILFNPIAFVLVFGGTLSATLISYPWYVLRHLPSAVKLMFIGRRLSDEDRQETIEQMARLAEKTRTGGASALMAEAAASGDPLLSYGAQMVSDGMGAEMLRENLERRILITHQHHLKTSDVFRTMATLAPIFGLLGTLIGVVQILRNLSDPTSMGEAMAIAITTTFYGIFGANFLFLPTAIKLSERNDGETLRGQIVAEGLIAVAEGELPLMVRKRLNAFLLHALREGSKEHA